MIRQKLLKTASIFTAMSLALSSTAFGFTQMNQFGPNNFQQNSGYNMNTQTGTQTGNSSSNSSSHSKVSSYMSQKGIMKGDSYGDFNLDANVKRGDIMLMIVRAFTFSTSSSNNFSDVAKESYYYDAIATTRSLGISKGDGTNFYPENDVTIEEAIALIQRSVSVIDKDGDLYSDIDLEGLYSDSELSEYATRLQIAEMLYYVLTGDTDFEDAFADAYSDSDIDTIEYTTDSDEEVTFDEDDFTEAFDDVTGDDLNKVKFTLPSSYYGKLYYDYESSSDYGSLVTSSKSYYVDDEPAISDVTFVPNSNYDGTVAIKYTAYDEDGNTYNGEIDIDVDNIDTTIDTIEYTTDSDEEVTFDEDDFTEAFDDATGDYLYKIKFALPSSTYGKLYYDYSSSSDYGSVVTTSKSYYVDDDPAISDVTFVPKSTYDGTVTIKYTAYDEDGNTYDGTIEITVED